MRAMDRLPPATHLRRGHAACAVTRRKAMAKRKIANNVDVPPRMPSDAKVPSLSSKPEVKCDQAKGEREHRR